MKLLAVVLSSLTLVACGGGGGSSTSEVPSVAALNSSNQTIAAQDAVSVSYMPLMATQTLVGAQTLDESVLFGFARSQMSKLPAYLVNAKANSTLTGAIQSETMACTHGGTLMISASDVDNNGLISAGDSVSITANGCVQTEGTLSGALAFVVNSVTGDFGSPVYSAGMTMTFNAFAITSAQFSASANGSLTMSVNATGVNAASTTLTASALSISGTYAGVTRTRSLANYSASATRSPDPTYGHLTSFSVSGTLTSSALSSQPITFATATPFVVRASDRYPSSGVLVISGAANSKVRLTALSATQVRQELDADGDGVYEASTTVNWNTLM